MDITDPMTSWINTTYINHVEISCVCIIDLYMDSLKDGSSVPTGDTSAGRWRLAI